MFKKKLFIYTWEQLTVSTVALETVPIGYMELFDLGLNCYEKLFQYSHFQSDIPPVSRGAAFVLVLRGVM